MTPAGEMVEAGQRVEFRRLEGEAYAWCKLFATGERSPSDPLFIAWYGRALELECGEFNARLDARR